MSDDKIAEIRDRHSKRTGIDHNGSYRLDGYSYPGTLTQSQRDLETALAEVERLRAALRWYADPRNHFPVERRSPGDPDPAVVFVEEPPIMDDCGRRARAALEGEA